MSALLMYMLGEETRTDRAGSPCYHVLGGRRVLSVEVLEVSLQLY